MSNSLPDEKLLLKQVAEGDEIAFSKVFHAYRDKLFAFIYRLSESREVAEDVLQEVFLKIWQKRERLADVENFNAFLFRVARNHTLNLLKKMALETLARSKSGRKDSANRTTPEQQLFLQDVQASLQIIVEDLPPRQKEIYRLKREQHLKQEEIARQLDISPSTVKNHFTEALRTIRARLLQRYPDLLISVLCLIFLFIL